MPASVASRTNTKFLRQPEWTASASTPAIFIDPPGPSTTCEADYSRGRSGRPIASDRHSAAGARLRVIVPQRLMLDAAVVPEGDRMGPPAKADLELLPCAKLAQKIQDCAALF